MTEKEQFDFWYAVNNTHVIRMPDRKLETFGATNIDYKLISELMDSVDRVRVREGKLKANRPEIITPSMMDRNEVEGFGTEALEYLEWLRNNEQDLVLLKYGFSLKKDETSDHIITDNLQTVSDRVVREAGESAKATAVVIGVEQPWEVCLMKLMVDLVQHSVLSNVQEFQKDRDMLSGRTTETELRRDIEEEFRLAEMNPGRIEQLGRLLQRKGLFKQYEDRFFALLKNRR